MSESIDVLNTAKVSERPANKLASTNVTNELARAINASGSVFRQGVEDGEPPYPDRRFYLVWDSGPGGEADFTNHVYWIREAYVVNPATDAITEPLKLQEIPVTDPKGEGRWLPATNMCERPKNTGGTETAGSHSLPKGTLVFDLETIIDPKGTMRHFFRSECESLFKITGARSKGGFYKANFWTPPASTLVDVGASGSISEANYGTIGDEVHFFNRQEVGLSTHKLTSGTQVVKFVRGVQSILRASDGKPIYEGNLINVKPC
jgi:hypothetical protein